MFSLKNDRNHRLETGWNDRIIEHRENKYIKSVDRQDILNLMRQTAPAAAGGAPRSQETITGGDSVFSTKPTTAARRKKVPPLEGAYAGAGGAMEPAVSEGPTSMYESITKAVGFKHHKGTDRNAELKVLKVLLQRENKLIELQTECNKITREVPALRNSGHTGILDLLSQIRDLCVQILENIMAWRETMVSADADAPRPFMWQRQNYILKMVDDLNFLSYVDPLVSAMKIPPEKMVKNPLMLPETLDGMNMDDEAFVRAKEDASGNNKGPVFLERLRLRIAEQVFVKEIEFNKFGMPSIAWTEYNPSLVSNEPSLATGVGDGSLHADNPARLQQHNEQRQQALLDWQFRANQQLKRILSTQGEQLRSASTHRLSIPSPNANAEEFVGNPKFSFYPTPVVVPSLLTDLHLGASEDADEQRSPIYLRGHFRESPKLTQIAQKERAGTASAAGPTSSGGARPKSDGRADSGEEAFAAGPTSGGKPSKRKGAGKDIRERRGLPDARPKLSAGVVSQAVIQPLLGVSQPPTTVLRAAGAVRILIAESDEIPEDLTWPRFLELAQHCDIADTMSSLDINNVPKFKLRAVAPFLDQLMNPLDMDDATEDVKESVQQITNWVQQVIDLSENPSSNPPRTAPPPSSVSPVGSTFESHPELRRGNSQGQNKKAVRQKRTTRDTLGGGATEARLLAYRPPKPHDSSLAIVYSEMIAHLFVRPVVLSLLVPSTDKDLQLPPTSKQGSPDAFKKGLDKQLAKYIVAKVYDAATSHTSEIILNLREYVRYQEDLVQRYEDENVRQLYQPERVGWWIENLKNVATVSIKPGGDMVLRVSKTMIGRRVARFLGVYMSNDSGDEAEDGLALTELSANNSTDTGGDFYGSHELPPSQMVKQRQNSPQKNVDAKKMRAPVPVTVVAPAGHKKKPKTTTSTVKPPSTAHTKQHQKSETKKETQAEEQIPEKRPAQYGSKFSTIPDNAMNRPASAPVQETKADGQQQHNCAADTNMPADPYAEPPGGFKIAKNENKSSIMPRAVVTKESEATSVTKLKSNEIVKPKSNETAKSRANEIAKTETAKLKSNETAKQVVTKVAPEPHAIQQEAAAPDLSNTAQSMLYDDEFEDAEEAPAAAVTPMSNATDPAIPKSNESEKQIAADVASESPAQFQEAAAPDLSNTAQSLVYDDEFEDAEEATAAAVIPMSNATDPAIPKSNESAKQIAADVVSESPAQFQEAAAPDLSNTAQSLVYDDEFEDAEEAPAAAVTPMSNATDLVVSPVVAVQQDSSAPAESKEGLVGYNDEFEDAGYGDEFEDAEREQEGQSSKKSDPPLIQQSVEPAVEVKPIAVVELPAPVVTAEATVTTAPTEPPTPVVGTDWKLMQKQLTQELESPSSTVNGEGNSYIDAFDPIGNDSAVLAEESKFGGEEELRLESNNKNNGKIEQAQSFDIEIVNEKKELKEAILAAAASAGDEADGDYGDDFDD